MNTLLFSLLATANALDEASGETFADTAMEINAMVSAGQIETHIAAFAIDAIEREIEICISQYLADGESVDLFKAASREIRKFRARIG
jgi:hypothetical protein